MEVYRRFFHSLSTPIIVVSADGTIIDFNPSFAKFSGCIADECIGKPFREIPLYPCLYIPKNIRSYSEYFNSDPGALYPFEIEKENGSLQGFYRYSQVGKDGGDEDFALEFTDIAGVRPQGFDNEAFQNLINASPMGFHLYSLKPDGRLIFLGANPAADEILGIDHSQLIGKTIEESFPSLRNTELPDRYRKVALEGGYWTTESAEYEDENIKGAFEVFAFQSNPGYTVVRFVETSERSKMEQELFYSKNLLEAVVDQTPFGIIIAQGKSGNWKLSSVNKEARKILGLSEKIYEIMQEENGATFSDLMIYFKVYRYDGTLVPESELPVNRIFQKEVTILQESYLISRADGSTRDILVSGAPIYNKESSIQGGLLILTDVTEYRIKARELELTRSLLEAVFEQNSSPVFIVTYPDSIIRMINHAAISLLGIESETSYIGMKLFDFQKTWLEYDLDGNPVPIDDLPIMKALRGIPTENTMMRIVRKDGTERWELASGVPINNSQGDQIAAMAVFPDITELKLTQDSLQESEGRYRFLFEMANDGLAIITDIYFVECNKRFCEMFGRPREKIIGHSPGEFSPEFQADEKHSHPYSLEYIKAARDGRPQLFNWIHSKPDGTLFEVEVSLGSFTIYGEVYILAIVRDITEKKALEEALRQSEEQLIQSQKLESIGRLAGGVAHDLNNLLTPILGYSDLLLTSELSEDNPIYEMIQNISDAAIRAKELTHQLLAFGRKQTLVMETLNLNTVLQSFGNILKRTIRENINIRTHFSPDLKNIQGDVSQIEQVILNLIVNAQDAMPDGGRIIIETENVELDTEYTMIRKEVIPGEYVRMCISDSGSGISAEFQEKVFEPFFTTKPKGQGTGLGLSTVYGIVKQHGGNVWLYSEPGKGTTFKVYFPVIHNEVILKEKPKYEISDKNTEKTILLVEDNESVREMTAQLLLRLGYKTVVSISPANAVNLAKKHCFDLLLTDVIMPEMTGVQLYKKIVKFQPEIKVLYMSGYTDNVIAHHGVLDDGINFLQKPFSTKTLAEKLDDIFDS
jgi:PAS domain S-box-containing protein